MADYCPWPWTINVANFVSTKLWFDPTSTANYEAWREQMLCLIEGQDMLGFIDGSVSPPPETLPDGNTNTDYVLWRRTDRLLKGWILGSVHESMVSQIAFMNTARDVWLELENKFSQLAYQIQSQAQINASAPAPAPAPAPTGMEQNIMEVQGRIDLTKYLPLHKAALRGDWEAAKRIFDADPYAIRAVLNSGCQTPLFIAVAAGKTTIHFVQKIVEMMPDDAIKQTDSSAGHTALHDAAVVGNIEAAIILVNRMPSLLYVPNNLGYFPLQVAAIWAQKRMVQYLISVTTEQIPYYGMAGLYLLTALIVAEFFDVALDLVEKYPHLAKMRYPNGDSALSSLAWKKSVFSNGRRFSFWEHLTRPTTEKRMTIKRQARSLLKCLCNHMEDMSFEEAQVISRIAVTIAAKEGNRDVVEMVIEAFPSAIDSTIPSGQNMFHIAVENRSEDVFNLIYQMKDSRYAFSGLVDIYGNNLLHTAGKLAPSHKLNAISGAALQMQREVQWYKEVENFVPPNFGKEFNKNDKNPWMVFTEQHEKLKEDGEKWMKDTSASFTIAAALIATVMFAAAITVPGGNENSTGFPMFSKDIEFIVFAVSDAVSLFTSTTSLLMFLSILTSRYAEEDFLRALPKRLIIGLATLFISITFMMVAFSVTIYLVFGRKNAWVLIPVAALACLPVTSFVLLQYPLLIDLMSSTYGRGIFGKQSNRPFY